jgi:ribonuclease P protein component
MLPRSLRLSSSEFRGTGYKTVATHFFSLKARANHLAHNRIGVIVPRSIHKNAVKRNFWKRQAKAALMRLAPAGRDLFLVLSPKINTLTAKQFRKIFFESSLKIS